MSETKTEVVIWSPTEIKPNTNYEEAVLAHNAAYLKHEKALDDIEQKKRIDVLSKKEGKWEEEVARIDRHHRDYHDKWTLYNPKKSRRYSKERVAQRYVKNKEVNQFNVGNKRKRSSSGKMNDDGSDDEANRDNVTEVKKPSILETNKTQIHTLKIKGANLITRPKHVLTTTKKSKVDRVVLTKEAGTKTKESGSKANKSDEINDDTEPEVPTTGHVHPEIKVIDKQKRAQLEKLPVVDFSRTKAGVIKANIRIDEEDDFYILRRPVSEKTKVDKKNPMGVEIKHKKAILTNTDVKQKTTISERNTNPASTSSRGTLTLLDAQAKTVTIKRIANHKVMDIITTATPLSAVMYRLPKTKDIVTAKENQEKIENQKHEKKDKEKLDKKMDKMNEEREKMKISEITEKKKEELNEKKLKKKEEKVNEKITKEANKEKNRRERNEKKERDWKEKMMKERAEAKLHRQERRKETRRQMALDREQMRNNPAYAADYERLGELDPESDDHDSEDDKFHRLSPVEKKNDDERRAKKLSHIMEFELHKPTVVDLLKMDLSRIHPRSKTVLFWICPNCPKPYKRKVVTRTDDDNVHCQTCLLRPENERNKIEKTKQREKNEQRFQSIRSELKSNPYYPIATITPESVGTCMWTCPEPECHKPYTMAVSARIQSDGNDCPDCLIRTQTKKLESDKRNEREMMDQKFQEIKSEWNGDPLHPERTIDMITSQYEGQCNWICPRGHKRNRLSPLARCQIDAAECKDCVKVLLLEQQKAAESKEKQRIEHKFQEIMQSQFHHTLDPEVTQKDLHANSTEMCYWKCMRNSAHRPFPESVMDKIQKETDQCRDCSLEEIKTKNTVSIESEEKKKQDSIKSQRDMDRRMEKFETIKDEFDLKRNDVKVNTISLLSNQRYAWVCRRGNCKFVASMKQRTSKSNRGCPSCYTVSDFHRSCQEVIEHLQLKDIIWKAEYTFDDCFLVNRLRFDFCLQYSDGRVFALIELDGLHHFQSVSFGGIPSDLAMQQLRDRIKTKFARSNSIPLLRISWSERYNILTHMENFIRRCQSGFKSVLFFGSEYDSLPEKEG